MDYTDETFASLMERVRNGCPEAIEKLLHKYGGHIRRVVRRQLHSRLRSQFDSLDFQQDVWASFFGVDAQKYHFECPEALVRFLSDLAYNKVVEVFRTRLQAPKRDLNRERSLNHAHFGKAAPEVAGREPTPSQAAIANEEWQRMLDEQPPHRRPILELLRQGHTHAEIARRLGFSPKMVQRLLQSLKQRGGES